MNHLHITGLWINSLMGAFSQHGLNTQALVKGLAGFSNNQLLPDHSLNLAAARTLWHRAQQQSQDPLLGLHIGFRQNFRSTGVLMPICWHSPSAGVALEHISNFQQLISENGQFRITRSNDRRFIECEYVPTASATPVNQHQILSVVTGTLLLLREISGAKAMVETLYVPEDIDAELSAEALDCKVENRSGNFTLVFVAASLVNPIAGRDEHLYHINLAYAEGMMRAKREGQTLIGRVKQIIGSVTPASVNIDQVAAELGLHRRVVQRNLAEQGASFRHIKEALLREYAVDLLIRQNTDIDAIAEQLGYSEPSAFQRAFKKWFAVTPRQFREQNAA